MGEFSVSTEETGGAFSLLKSTVAGDGAPPLYHREPGPVSAPGHSFSRKYSAEPAGTPGA